MSDRRCGCGAECRGGPHYLWDGDEWRQVCEPCWLSADAAVLEACVGYEIGHYDSLEDALRQELVFRGKDWTREAQALCDKRYMEWYMEPAL